MKLLDVRGCSSGPTGASIRTLNSKLVSVVCEIPASFLAQVKNKKKHTQIKSDSTTITF
jgi:hypothetical protein